MDESVIKPGMTTSTKTFLKKLIDVDVIPPDNGKKYTAANNTFHVGKGKLVRISERQRNLAVIFATEPTTSITYALIRAGYDLNYDSWDGSTTAPMVRSELDRKYRRVYTQKALALQTHIQEDACEALNIDAAWVLGQQVALFEETKRKGAYAQAVRLLHDISYHTDVDARISNKLEVTEKVDYEAILNSASNRTSLPNPDVIDVTPIILEDNSGQAEDIVAVQSTLT